MQVRHLRKNSMHLIKFPVCSCWKERFFFACVNGPLTELKIAGSENCKPSMYIEIEFIKDAFLSILEIFCSLSKATFIFYW